MEAGGAVMETARAVMETAGMAQKGAKSSETSRI